MIGLIYSKVQKDNLNMFIIYSQALQLSFYVNFIQNLLHKKKPGSNWKTGKAFNCLGCVRDNWA